MITWEQKVELCSFLNQGEYAQALDIVINNDMDEQGWNMFFEGIELTNDSINPLIDKHKVVFQKAKDCKTSSFRIAIRMARYDQIIEDLTK